MFESEIGFTLLDATEIPANVLSQFQETARLVSHRSVIPWAEHCSECSAPACFSTCEFYDPRPDMKCRRFRGGFFAMHADHAAVSDIVRVTFGRWGKLEGRGPTTLLPTADAINHERRDLQTGKMISGAPVPFGAKVYLMRARQRRKLANRATDAKGSGPQPNAFVVETYNPSQASVTATLSFRPQANGDRPLFQHLLRFEPGYNRAVVACDQIAAQLTLSQPFLVQMEPHENGSEVTLFFGLVDFARVDGGSLSVPAEAGEAVSSRRSRTGDAKPIKCVVWDLDNTVWHGTLIEDGLDGIAVNEDAVRVVRELDRRGILNSIASKNHPADALAALARFGLAEYFLCPQISWAPKSGAIAEIARRLNIGIDSLAFVDDQAFELAEVQAAHPDVLVVEAGALAQLPDHPRFDLPVTAESRMRRALYQDEMKRDTALARSGGDNLEFLRTCGLRLAVRRLDRADVERVHELAQRTNQMNFSGKRYTLADIEAMMSAPRIDTYVISARDRFGEYGIVGFAVVDGEAATMSDLMFSCRIQGKHVDRAFVGFLIERYRQAGHDQFTALYRETKRNRPAARLFWDLGFEKLKSEDGLHRLAYDTGRLGVPQQDIVEVSIE